MRLGIDTGGTFSDFIVIDEATGEVRAAKVPSTPSSPPAAMRAGLARLEGIESAQQIVVGTTVATNAVIQRQGPRILLITNAGFTDIPFIARLDKERLYDLNWSRPRPLVQRADCVGVRGRIDHHGREIEPLDESSLEPVRTWLLTKAGGEAPVVAICCLFAYLSPDHERRIAAFVRSVRPDAVVSASHEVSPVWREYERASTTIADAFVKPVAGQYISGIGTELRQRLRAAKDWNLLASNGGYLRAEEAGRSPVRLLLSGLAGGVIGAGFFAQAAGYRSVFTLDMGGTSCDIGVILEGEQQYAHEFQVAWGVPVSLPCVAVDTIGAGGGSILWQDKGGLLRVGPQSAGAEPGPVAYGLGGTQPTLTDANLTLGRLDPGYFLGGTMRVDGQESRRALGALGSGLGLTAHAVALAAVRTADENMANAVRLIAVDRGLDPREFALVAFGGAGPLHARMVAERLDIKTVLVPPHPGLCSAFGAAIAQVRVDRVRSYYARSDQPCPPEMAQVEREVREDAVTELRRSVDVGEPHVIRSAALRYAGQNYELEVRLPDRDLDGQGWNELLSRFEAGHERQYGFALPGEAVELIHLRATALREEKPPRVARFRSDSGEPGHRSVWFDEAGPIRCAVYRREQIPSGMVLAGPAIIEDADSTTVMFEGDTVQADDSGVLVLTLGGTHD
jgi:N-methylhydantoinase A